MTQHHVTSVLEDVQLHAPASCPLGDFRMDPHGLRCRPIAGKVAIDPHLGRCVQVQPQFARRRGLRARVDAVGRDPGRIEGARSRSCMCVRLRGRQWTLCTP